jgi:hypothetical protein
MSTIATDLRISQLLGLILQKRTAVVERLQVPVQLGEPFDKKHKEIMALLDEAHVYVAELEELVGREEAVHHWNTLGRIAFGLST